MLISVVFIRDNIFSNKRVIMIGCLIAKRRMGRCQQGRDKQGQSEGKQV